MVKVTGRMIYVELGNNIHQFTYALKYKKTNAYTKLTPHLKRKEIIYYTG